MALRIHTSQVVLDIRVKETSRVNVAMWRNYTL